MGINVGELREHIKKGDYVDIDLTLGKVQLYFIGGKLPEECPGIDEKITWNFEIEEARSRHITKEFITKLKHIAHKLQDETNIIAINVYPELAKKVKDLLLEEEFHHWIDEEEDHGFWWETTPNKVLA